MGTRREDIARHPEFLDTALNAFVDPDRHSAPSFGTLDNRMFAFVTVMAMSLHVPSMPPGSRTPGKFDDFLTASPSVGAGSHYDDPVDEQALRVKGMLELLEKKRWFLRPGHVMQLMANTHWKHKSLWGLLLIVLEQYSQWPEFVAESDRLELLRGVFYNAVVLAQSDPDEEHRQDMRLLFVGALRTCRRTAPTTCPDLLEIVTKPFVSAVTPEIMDFVRVQYMKHCILDDEATSGASATSDASADEPTRTVYLTLSQEARNLFDNLDVRVTREYLHA